MNGPTGTGATGPTSRNRRTHRWSRIVLIAGFLLAALNLRPALANVAPLLDRIMADLELSAFAGGLITTSMVVCLGVLAPVAPLLASRMGLDRALWAATLLVTVGVVIRSAGGPAALYLGAALAGCAIAVLNVLMPAVVKHHFPERVGVFTGVYVSALVFGAATAAGLTVPFAREIGQGWRPALAAPAVLGVVAAVAWLPQVRTSAAWSGAPRHLSTLLRDRVTWYVTGFMGLQSLTFYVVLTWLPTVLQDAGLDAATAGFLLGFSNIVQLSTTLTMPVLAGRARSQAPHIALMTSLTIGGYAGLLLAPAALPWLWALLLGLGQGGCIALALFLIAVRIPDPAMATSLSAIAQSVGYVLAALGPVLIGLIYQVRGGWGAALLVVLLFCGLQLGVGVLAGRSRTVRTPADPGTSVPG